MPNYNRYNKLHDEILTRLENGEITTEQAKDVIDLAFDKYVVEKVNIELSDNAIHVLENVLTKCKNLLHRVMQHNVELSKIKAIEAKEAIKYLENEKDAVQTSYDNLISKYSNSLKTKQDANYTAKPHGNNKVFIKEFNELYKRMDSIDKRQSKLISKYAGY